MKKYILEIVVFSVGAIIMILELTAIRVLAPFTGTSIIAWTSLLGIILGSLSLGYYLGGRLADKHPSPELLAKIIFTAGALILFIALLNTQILEIFDQNIGDLRILSLASSSLFSLPSVFLGMVFPFAIKLKLKKLKVTGETSGSLYAISTLGSLLGTFLTGFFLLAILGSQKILLGISLILLLLSFGLSPAFYSLILLVFPLIFFFSPQKDSAHFFETDTQYNHVILKEGVDKETQRPILSLITGRSNQKDGRQGSIYLDRDDELVLEPIRFFRLITFFNPKVERVLVLGGGTYSFPSDFLKRNPGAVVDVVEIDPGLTLIAKKFFNLKEDPRLTIYHEDARRFINKNKNRYDAVLVDAYSADISVPFQLTTLEAIQKLYNSLSQNGVLIANIAAKTGSDKNTFLLAEITTYRKIFPRVLVFPLRGWENPDIPQNVMLVALKSPTPKIPESGRGEEAYFLSKIWPNPESSRTVLTDDFAPVEYLTARDFLKL